MVTERQTEALTAKQRAARLMERIFGDHDERSRMDDLIELAVALVQESCMSGRFVPRLPPGQRPAVVESLTECVMDQTKLDVYTAAVQASLLTLGQFPIAAAMPDLPQRLVHERGFDALTDEQLAWVAADPDALNPLSRGLLFGATGPDGEPLPTGKWYLDAVRSYTRNLPKALAEGKMGES